MEKKSVRRLTLSPFWWMVLSLYGCTIWKSAQCTTQWFIRFSSFSEIEYYNFVCIFFWRWENIQHKKTHKTRKRKKEMTVKEVFQANTYQHQLICFSFSFSFVFAFELSFNPKPPYSLINIICILCIQRLNDLRPYASGRQLGTIRIYRKIYEEHSTHEMFFFYPCWSGFSHFHE